MEFSFEVDKIIKFTIYMIMFFPSGGGSDNLLVRL